MTCSVQNVTIFPDTLLSLIINLERLSGNIYSNFGYFKMYLNKTNQKWQFWLLFISYSEPYSNFFTSYSESFSTSFSTCFPRIQACFYNFRQIWGCLRMPEHSQLKICLLFIFILKPKRFINLFCSH